MFNIQALSDTVYLFYFQNHTDLALSFLRYQEYYESPNDDFRNHSFTIEEYKDWYAKDRGEFSYVEDWAGFNIPSRVFVELLDKGIKDLNEYDNLMIGAYQLIKRNCKQDKFYIIGVSTLDNSVLEHEKAHGLYYTNEDYKKECDEITASIPKELYDEIKESIIKLGYTEEVIDDEIQAYMSEKGVRHFELMNPSVKRKHPYYKEYRILKRKYNKIYKKYSRVFEV
jgi:hypothetical protein